MSKPGLKRYVLIFENRQVIAITAERFKLGNGVEFFDQQGDCIAVAPSSGLLLVTEAEHLETLDDLGEEEDAE